MKRRTLALALASLGWFLVLAGRHIVSVLLIRIEGTLHMDHAMAGAAMTAMWLFYGMMQFPSGVVGDRVGKQKVLTWAVLVFSIAFMLIGASANSFMFFGVMILVGISTGFYQTIGIAFVSDLYRKNRGRALGIQSSVGSLSGLMAFTAPLLVLVLHWRIILLIFGIFGIFIGLRFHFLDTCKRSQPTKGSVKNNLKNSAKAMLDPFIISVFLVNFIMAFIWMGFLSFYPTFLQETKNLSEFQSGICFALLSLGGILFKSVVGPLCDKFNQRAILLVIIAINIIGLSLLVYLESFILMLMFSFVLSLGGASFVVFNYQLMGHWEDDERGGKLGFYRTINILAGSNTAFFVGYTADKWGFKVPFAVFVGLMGIAAVILTVLLLKNKNRMEKPDHSV